MGLIVVVNAMKIGMSKMKTCLICNTKRINKDMLQCAYCKKYVCGCPSKCVYEHLGNCDDDPHPLTTKQEKEQEVLK